MSSKQQQIQKNNQFYVVVEINSYNIFYLYVETSKQYMQKNEIVEIKGEVLEKFFSFS